MSVCVSVCFTQTPAGVVPPVWVVSLSIKTVLTPFSFVFTCLHEAKSAWSATGAFYQGCQKCQRLQFYVGYVCVYVRVCVCVKVDILCLLRVHTCVSACVWAVTVCWKWCDLLACPGSLFSFRYSGPGFNSSMFFFSFFFPPAKVNRVTDDIVLPK